MRKNGVRGSGAILIPDAAPNNAPELSHIEAKRSAIIVGSALQWKPDKKMAAGEAKKKAATSRLLLSL